MTDDTTQVPCCTICYNHLNPIVEHLQSISICGHVFHELCIQQWFESCSKGKKKCPICKQTCSVSNVSRLYFQSAGDCNDSNVSQKLHTHKDDFILKLELNRLELKVNVLNSALKSRENDINSASSELSVCKAMLKEEASLKEKTLEQNHKINHILNLKTEELRKSDEECNELQKKNMDLAKDLAPLKLVSDLDLDEDQIVKRASLGTKPDSKETVDILKKCSYARNKLYKELITKCNTLGKNVTRSYMELEKAKEQIKELEKIQKLETAKKSKDNGVLRAVNTSSKTIKEPDIHLGKTKRKRLSENVDKSNNIDGVSSYIIIEDNAPKVSVSSKFSSNDSVPQCPKSTTTDATYISKKVHERSEHIGVYWHDCKDEDMPFVHKNGQDKPMLNIVKEASSPFLNSQEADFPFSHGLLDGTTRHAGKWCIKGQSKAYKASGDLIAVGSDGRGGTIKVLKPHNSSSLNSRGSLTSAKSGKIGTKKSSLQSRGCLRIDHYFGKTGQ